MEATSTFRSLASAPLLSPPCPKPSVEAGAPSGLREGPAFEGSPYPKGSTWLGLYERTVVQCVRRALPGAVPQHAPANTRNGEQWASSTQ